VTTTRERLGRNVRWLGFLQVILLLVRFVPRVYLWRTLGDVGLGQYQIALIWLELSSDALGLAQEDYIPRDASQDPAARSRMVTASLTVTALLVPIVAVAMLAVGALYGATLPVSLFFIFLAAAFRAPTRTLLSFHTADENLRPFSLWQAGERVGVAVVTVLVLVLGGELRDVFLWLPAAYLLLGIPVWVSAIRRFGVCAIGAQELRDAFRKGFEFTGLRATSLLYLHLNTLLVERLLGMGPAGVYALAKSLVDLLKTPTILIAKSLYPVLSRRVADSPAAVNRLITQFEKIMLAYSLPFFVGNAVVAVPLFALVYERDSAFAAALSIPFTAALVLGSARRPFATYLTAVHEQNKATGIMVVGVVLNVGATLILVPRYGLNGAVAAVLLYEAVTLVLFARFVARRGVAPAWIQAARGPVLAAAAMAGAVWLVRDAGLLLSIGVGAAVYMAALAAIGFSADERDVLRLMIGQRMGSAKK
jgi:O-antigen/teichoic acid export membrane protein